MVGIAHLPAGRPGLSCTKASHIAGERDEKWKAAPNFFFPTLCAGVYSCAALSSDIDVRGVNFKQARPVDRDRLVEAVVEPSQDSISLLEQDAEVLKAFPKLRVKIVGFTDDQECQGNDCVALSLRRAKYVRDWFLTQGISYEQIEGPEGRGNIDPIDNNAMEEGRARNRRAEVQVVTLPDGEPYPPSN